MKYFLSFSLLIFTYAGFSQTNLDYKLLVNHWTEAKIDSLGRVVQADMNLGGWSSLSINNDKTIVHAGSFDCGFGHSREGKWELNPKNKTITFFFSKKIGFMNAPGTEKIKEKEIYTIEHLSPNALILKNKTQTKAFIKTENITQ